MMGLKYRMIRKRFKRKSVGNVVSALSIVYVLAALLRTDPSVFRGLDWRLCLPVFAAGTALKAMTVWMSARAWCLWLECYAKRRCDRKEAFRVYARANLGKYLPGNLMHYVERNLFAEKLELTQKQLAAASLSEVVSLVLAACLTGLLFCYRQVVEVQRMGTAGSFVLAAGCAAGAAVLLLLLYALRRAGARRFLYTVLTNIMIYAVVLAVLGWILVPVSWCLGLRPDPYQSMQIMAAYVIAWALGFVVPGAPGGIGVRETVLTLLLAPVIGRDIIVILGVLHRLITIAGDCILWFLPGICKESNRGMIK